MKILMVCLGNICRSPLAEGILRQKCKEKNLDWIIDSAGTGRWHAGSMPDKRSIAIAKQNGIDISTQRARTINSSDYDYFDIIFAMDRANFKNLRAWALSSEEENKIKLIMSVIDEESPLDVPDPYYNDNGFKEVFTMLDGACAKIIEQYA